MVVSVEIGIGAADYPYMNENVPKVFANGP